MTKKYLVTDFYHYEKYNNDIPKIYLELPFFDEKNKLKKNIIFKKWKNSKEKIKDHNINVFLFNFFLKKLTVYLNKYHNKNFSKRYWEIILTPWLWWFISSVTFKWSLISSIKKDKFIFLEKKIKIEDVIPIGIEDFSQMARSHFWNHYLFSKIIGHSFSKKIKVKKIEVTKNILEKNIIYQKLNQRTFKERIGLLLQKLSNFLFTKKKYLIFSTYMSNFQEIYLNFLVNNSILFYKAPRPNFLFSKIKKKVKRKKSKNFIIKKKGLINFLSEEIILNLPLSFLENFDQVEKLIGDISFPRKPEKIFTCLGFNRNTLIDRYIAKNLENGSSLILAQHGGNYFQHKFHYDTDYEPKISDQYLTWGNVKKKNTKAIGIIKQIKSRIRPSNRIILEVRVSKAYSRLKIDSGFFDNKKYLDNLCKFFSLIKNNTINENLYVKLSPVKWLWNEKKLFKSFNTNLKFLDDKKKMINEINSAKLIIQTFCGTGHLECLALNIPTVILFTNDMKFYNEKSRKYFKKFKKSGILHTDPISLTKFLKKIDSKDKIGNWWNNKKLQELLSKYRYDFGFLNKNKISDLKQIIVNE